MTERHDTCDCNESQPGEIRFRSGSPEETQLLGKKLGEGLQAGDVVALIGELGSGKTCLVQGICEGVGAESGAHSPSFVLMNIYGGRLAIFHFDLYRVQTADEVWALGMEEYLGGEGVAIIEWAEKAGRLLGPGHFRVELLHRGPMDREIVIGCSSCRRLRRLTGTEGPRT